MRRTYYSASAARDITVAEVMRPAVFIPDSPIDDLLREMQHDRVHIALLVEEHTPPPAW